MLAAMLGVFLVVSAATGFLLTAMQRQAAVLQATALEAQHEALAEIMNDSIKSAVDFQIYHKPLWSLLITTATILNNNTPMSR